MFKNMKVKVSMMIGWAITVVISIAIIISTLMIMTQQSKTYQEIIDTNVKAHELTITARLDANIVARRLRDIALTGDDEGDADRKARIDEVLGSLSENLTELKKIYPLSDTKNLDAYLDAVGVWGADIPDVVADLTSHNEERIAAGLDSVLNVCSPRLDTAAQLGQVVSDDLAKAQDDIIAAQQNTTTWAIVIIVVAMVVATLFVFIIELGIIKSITNPVEQVRSALVGFSQGKLDIPVNYDSTNELGDMCKALRTSQDVLHSVITDESRLLEEMGAGNFDVRTRAEDKYVGALSGVLASVRVINRSLSTTLQQIQSSSDQVSSGAEQVSNSAQALAQGATQQASAVEELSATVTEIAQGAEESVGLARESSSMSNDANAQITVCNEHMQGMVTAMEEIKTAAEEVREIIDTISNIAFQTNILALNAAVEAARAGSAGKGFAVVADEVRQLASKSDEASKATKARIENAITAVQKGSTYVADVSDALEKTVELVNSAVAKMGDVADASQQQAESIEQIREGIDQISAVVQNNSATSEQSAAASEELSSQAQLMKQLMAKFTLRDFSAEGMAAPAPKAPAAQASHDVSYSSGGSYYDDKY